MVSKRVILEAFLSLVKSIFLYFGGVFNKSYSIRAVIANEAHTISYPTRAHGIIVKYHTKTNSRDSILCVSC